MTSLSQQIGGLTLLALLAATPMATAQAQALPGPNEEAKLYDGAKKEGALVVYESGPLEAYQGFAQDFMQKYPGKIGRAHV